MASGRIRSTRMLRSWMVEQVSSGKYLGLIWDDEAKTMFRIPWKHAGKQDFRSEEDAAIFKAWAEFKGKLLKGGREDPASWKTRLRCALNKSPEFREVPERSQLDISEPYKVYLLVPVSEQGLPASKKSKCREQSRRQKRRSSESGSEEEIMPKQMKEEANSSPAIIMCVQDVVLEHNAPEELLQPTITMKSENDEYQFNLRIETTPPARALDSFHVSVNYLGQEVLKRNVNGNDVRIAYLPPAPVPPTTTSLMLGGFPRISLPEPSSTLVSNSESSLQLKALTTLLPFMEKGVVLTSTELGVYAQRFCQGRVFWTGPHTSLPKPQKMDRYVDPVLLFSKEAFRNKLTNFRMNEGEPPQCGITLCFGEEFSTEEEASSKLIIVQVTFPWAQKEVQDEQSIKDSMTLLANLASQSPNGEITLNLELVP